MNFPEESILQALLQAKWGALRRLYDPCDPSWKGAIGLYTRYGQIPQISKPEMRGMGRGEPRAELMAFTGRPKEW